MNKMEMMDVKKPRTKILIKKKKKTSKTLYKDDSSYWEIIGEKIFYVCFNS